MDLMTQTASRIVKPVVYRVTPVVDVSGVAVRNRLFNLICFARLNRTFPMWITCATAITGDLMPFAFALGFLSFYC
jgi:hypothetical protein